MSGQKTPVSLKAVQLQLDTVSAYLTKSDAMAYIDDKGTAGDSNELNGKDINHYRCSASCSWTSSGGSPK